MKRSPFIAGFLSLLIPGLGQIYRGQGNRGAIILFAAIVIANLNIIILPLISMANSVTPPSINDPKALWAYWIPRVVHDVASLWSIIFWFWAVIDAYTIKKKT